jgi:hypothetical protein
MFVQVTSRLTSRATTHSPTLLRFSGGLLSLILLAASRLSRRLPKQLNNQLPNQLHNRLLHRRQLSPFTKVDV